MRMSKFMRISADADPDAELRYTSINVPLEITLSIAFMFVSCNSINASNTTVSEV